MTKSNEEIIAGIKERAPYGCGHYGYGDIKRYFKQVLQAKDAERNKAIREMKQAAVDYDEKYIGEEPRKAINRLKNHIVEKAKSLKSK